LFPVVNFLKYVLTEVVLFSVVAFKTLTFHKVVWRHTWGVVESLVICSSGSDCEISLKIDKYTVFYKVKAYEVKAYKSVPVFWATL